MNVQEIVQTFAGRCDACWASVTYALLKDGRTVKSHDEFRRCSRSRRFRTPPGALACTPPWKRKRRGRARK